MYTFLHCKDRNIKIEYFLILFEYFRISIVLSYKQIFHRIFFYNEFDTVLSVEGYFTENDNRRKVSEQLGGSFPPWND